MEYFGGGIADNVVIPTCKLIVKGDIKVAETEGITVTHENGKQSLKRWEEVHMEVPRILV